MKKILVIEDTIEQSSLVADLLKEKGCAYLVAKNLAEASFAIQSASFDGVLTDLHFPEKEGASVTPPCGFAVLVMCAEKSLPVVVVSDIDHHFADYAKVVVNGIAKLHATGKIPFVMDSKDWPKGIQLLEEVMI